MLQKLKRSLNLMVENSMDKRNEKEKNASIFKVFHTRLMYNKLTYDTRSLE